MTAAAVVLGACGGDSAGSREAFCQQIRTDLDALNGNAITGGPDERKATAAAFQRVDRVAPDEIGSAWGQLTTVFVEVSELDMAQDSAYGDAFAAALDDSVIDAAQRVNQYVATQCGIDLNASSGDPLPGSTDEPADPADGEG